jgi:protein-S-isoprenylcysteine O-methyltransferase Ste14
MAGREGMKVAMTLLSASTYLYFAGAAKFSFVCIRFGWALCALTVSAAVAATLEVWSITAASPPDVISALGGLTGFAAAAALFTWATHTTKARPLSFAFSTDPPTRLITRGPYARIRHPCYTAYLSSYVAGLIVTHDRRLVLVVLLMAIFYIAAAEQEEAKFSRGPLATQYALYMSYTGRFAPRPLWYQSRRADRLGLHRHGR